MSAKMLAATMKNPAFTNINTLILMVRLLLTYVSVSLRSLVEAKYKNCKIIWFMTATSKEDAVPR